MEQLDEKWQKMDEKGKLALVLDSACTNERVTREVQRLWRSQF